MKQTLISSLVFSGLVLGSFWLGRSSLAGDGHTAWLEAQDRGSGGQGGGSGRGPLPPAPGPTPGIGTKTAPPLVYGGDNATGSATNGVIAVTGSYGVGTSVLYVLDTNTRQLAVYEARGGSAGSRKLFLVGARRIDLDLQLIGYNDDSESQVSYEQLQRKFSDLHKDGRTDGKADGKADGRADGKESTRDASAGTSGKTDPGREK